MASNKKETEKKFIAISTFLFHSRGHKIKRGRDIEEEKNELKKRVFFKQKVL